MLVKCEWLRQLDYAHGHSFLLHRHVSSIAESASPPVVLVATVFSCSAVLACMYMFLCLCRVDTLLTHVWHKAPAACWTDLHAMTRHYNS